MDEKKIRIELPNGVVKEGIDVPVDESNERWTEMKLKDGAAIRVKLSVIQVLRVNDEFDPEGNPLYVVKGAPMLSVVSVPDSLRKKS
jgi:hypothetical protein